MNARILLPLMVLLPLTAQADITESALRGTKVKLKSRPDSLVNHAHAIFRAGRVPLQNVVSLDGTVFVWGYKGSAHQALIDLLTPEGEIPSYFSDEFRTESSSYTYFAETGPLLVAIGEAQFGGGANIIALADPSYRFASIELTSISLDGAPLEPDEDFSDLSDFFGMSAQQWGLELSDTSGELSATFDIEWVTHHSIVSLPTTEGATANAGDWSVTVSEVRLDTEAPGAVFGFDFEPRRALGFYISDRDLRYSGMGYGDDSAVISYIGLPTSETEMVFSFPKKTHRETITVTFDIDIPAPE
jgi:hypothetical protein